LIKLLPYILFEKIYLYFSIGNGQLREPALCQLYRHTFVPCTNNRVCISTCTILSRRSLDTLHYAKVISLLALGLQKKLKTSCYRNGSDSLYRRLHIESSSCIIGSLYTFQWAVGRHMFLQKCPYTCEGSASIY